VYPVEILTQFAAFYDFSAATAAAMPMLIVTVMILVLEIRLLHTSVLNISLKAEYLFVRSKPCGFSFSNSPSFSTVAIIGGIQPARIVRDPLASGFKEIASGNRDSAGAAAAGEVSRQNLVKAKWDRLEKHQDELEARHEFDGGSLNFKDRLERF
jgi:hypothetical protein